MALPDDLRELIRDCVRRSLLPGATMPNDDEGLYGRVASSKMDRELEQLGYSLRTYVPAMNAPFAGGRGVPAMESLQLLAPLSARADKARRAVAATVPNPSISSIEQSVRRKTYIQSSALGHELRFPALGRKDAIRRLLKIALLPPLLFPAFMALILVGTSCQDCPNVLWEKLFRSAYWGAFLSLVMLTMVVLPALLAMIQYRQK